ncbi:MAG TPA: hypothetical protein P5180_14585 [Bacteroidales bacterium]|nr:hypothetical protein [Bacteroidales bacterium]HRW86653.1 hypothetical protein [Bacteroidales bacterium]
MKLKFLLPLLILAAALVFPGCKKGPEKLIAKTWKVTNVMTKGTIQDSVFTVLKNQLMNAEMTFSENKYTMTSGGNAIEHGTYSVVNDIVTVTTEEGMNMNAVVTKETLTLDTPDFMTTLQPK